MVKHVIFSLTQLSDPESLAVQFSFQIKEHVCPNANAIWLMDDGETVREVIVDGVKIDKIRQTIRKIDTSETLMQVCRERLMVWPEYCRDITDLFPGIKAPHLFPICSQTSVLGFLMVEKPEAKEVFQYLVEFAGIILENARLHQTVEEQRHELEAINRTLTHKINDLEYAETRIQAQTEELQTINRIVFEQNQEITTVNKTILRLSKASGIHEVSDVLLSVLQGHFQIQQSLLAIKDKDGHLDCVSASGVDRTCEEITRLLEHDELCRLSMDMGKIMNPGNCPGGTPPWNSSFDSWVVFPFSVRKGFGAIIIMNPAAPEKMETLEILFSQASVFLDNALLHNELMKAKGAQK